jgi:hypothetical protein
VNASTNVLVTPTTPVRAGDTLVIYANGLGPVAPAPASGDAASTTTLSPTTIPQTVTFSSARVGAAFAGQAPAFIGVNSCQRSKFQSFSMRDGKLHQRVLASELQFHAGIVAVRIHGARADVQALPNLGARLVLRNLA